MKRVSFHLFITGILVVGCGRADDGNNTPASGEQALIVTSDYQTGSYSLVNVSDRTVQKNIGVINADAMCRTDPVLGRTVIVSRLGADAVELPDPQQGFAITREYSAGAGTNPQDIAAASASRAYIPRAADARVLVVHPTEGTELGTVDLSAYADSDGVPEAAWAITLFGKVYVALQRLTNFAPNAYSSLVVIDGGSGEIEKEIRLAGANPFPKVRYQERIDRIVIGLMGGFGATDGGVVYLDPAAGATTGFLITEEELGGDLNDVVVLSASKGYAIVVVMDQVQGPMTLVVSFNPETGKKVTDLIVGEGFDHASLELTPDGKELWVTERKTTGPGIRIFNTETDQEVTDLPVDVGLPPFMICFTPSIEP